MNKPAAPQKLKLLFNNRILLLIDIFLNFLFILYYIPFINNVLEYVMELTKQSYITSQNLIPFLTSPQTILFILLVLFTFPMFLHIKLNALLYYCNTRALDKRPTPVKVLFYGIFKTFEILRKGRLALLFYSIPFYIFTNLPILFGITFHIELGFNVGANDEVFVKGLIYAVLIFVSFIIFRGAFVIPICINDDIGFVKGFRHSKALLSGRGFITFKKYFLVNLLLTIGYFLFYYITLFLTAIAVYLFTDKAMAVTVFLSVYTKLSFYATAFYGMLVFIINVNLIVSLYHTFQKEILQESLPSEAIYKAPVYHLKRLHKLIANGFLIFIFLVSVVNFYFTIRNDSLYLGDAFGGIMISSHRGNSYVAPENTIPALENAMIANSDYAEIDVQQTKDGSLILLHDNSLLRTAGINRFIWDLNQDDLLNLDVGSWFGSEFLNTRIPTVEDVMIFCKGKIKLNIEIKSNKRSPGMEENLVALIEKYEYEDQCIVSSANYESLVKVKQLNNKIKTGYILSAFFGNFYDKEYIDFFSIRYNYITNNVVENAHEAGKEVHAWTVNTTRELERMKSLGVDCIITDNPTLARKIIYRDDTNDTFIELINRMINNRTNYRVVNQ